ncbi:MAG: hypothetical protein QXE92_02585 [Thermofilaceae archaeon]
MVRKGVYSRVSEDVLNRFRQLVVKKHGQLRFFFSMELENALRRWIEENEEALGEGGGAHTSQEAPQRDDTKKEGKICRELPSLIEAVKARIPPGSRVSEGVIRRIVIETSRVAERRAVKSRVDALVAAGVLIPLDDKRYLVRGGDGGADDLGLVHQTRWKIPV